MITAQCFVCKHFWGMSRCDAFLDGIPEAIITGEADHTQPYPGDGGIRYEPAGNVVTESLAEAARSGAEQFAHVIDLAVRGLWGGTMSAAEFDDRMRNAVTGGFESAWFEGAAQVGVQPGEESNEERAILEELKDAAVLFIEDFSTFIQERSKAALGDSTGLDSCLSRAQLWANQYNMIMNRAKMEAGKNAKLVWRLGATDLHCPDCAKYNGRVYRASTWARWGIAPQSQELACHGYRCLCTLEPTDEPLTPGQPPRMTG